VAWSLSAGNPGNLSGIAYSCRPAAQLVLSARRAGPGPSAGRSGAGGPCGSRRATSRDGKPVARRPISGASPSLRGSAARPAVPPWQRLHSASWPARRAALSRPGLAPRGLSRVHRREISRRDSKRKRPEHTVCVFAVSSGRCWRFPQIVSGSSPLRVSWPLSYWVHCNDSEFLPASPKYA